jgi:hypothetical protein
MDLQKIEKNMVKGSPARLFPILPESKREEKATSMLLSVFTMVPDFASAVLEEVGAPIGKRAKISCFTEVSFKGMKPNSRPDGLIVVESSKGTWAALVESKIGSSDVTEDQLTDYIDISKAQGFDAVITISNQFVGDPSHHPLALSKSKRKGIGLFHFSWLAITSKALLLIDSKSVTDAEQSFVMRELVRYMQSNKTGMSHALSMSKEWKWLCNEVHQGHLMPKSSPELAGAVADWFQLLRFLSIKLSLAVGEPCSTHLPKKHLIDANARIQDAVCAFSKAQSFSGEIKILNAASRLTLSASLVRKTMDLSVRLETPKDVKQQRTAINFVLSQLKGCAAEDVMVVVNWPGRTPVTKLPLHKALDDDERKALLMPELKCLPVSVDLVRVIDVGARVKTPRYLPETAEAEIKRFYEEIVQRLQKWVPKAPKVKPASVDDGERLSSDPHRVIDSGASERSGFSGWNTHRPLRALLSPASGNHDGEMRHPGLGHGRSHT